MIFTEIDELEYKINELKKELIQIAEATGLISHETINCSQELDKHISNYQKLSYEKSKLEKCSWV